MITINGYPIDASISEGHSFDSEVTQYPVEKGPDITDNVRPKPITVSLEGVVSDTPIGNIAEARNKETNSPGGSLDFLPSDDALARLLKIRDAREPVVIESSLQRFEDMVMTSLAVPRDAKTGEALRFSATFQQIVFITNNRTTVRVAIPQAQKKVKLGLLQNKTCSANRFLVDPKHRVWFDESVNSWREAAALLAIPPKFNTWLLVRGALIAKRPAVKDVLEVEGKLAK